MFLLSILKAPEFLPGRQASIIYKGKRIGTFGIVHPEVLSLSNNVSLNMILYVVDLYMFGVNIACSCIL